ncbi:MULTISPECIES: DUF4291 domain-containing protein [Niastella]|uniref:DUF4291 domain-containing protein n=1 Tax=Niastella soli TaxID=2821487 RepID=A0ABS3YQM2_9BACT|nr:DUF4291 domain-containing protein [Niastella soli]MBO9200197.1 DUF4291 domain-containing protein [Niastella soli]
MSKRVIRALYDDNTITVYQAYNNIIAAPAVKQKTFVSPPFKIERMTWIKPSFLWMMYRSGWATKENQECILAIKLKREGFEWALNNAVLAHHDHTLHGDFKTWQKALKITPVRIQWDPEKDLFLQPLPYRSIQIGLSGIAVEKYINDWITDIEDITPSCQHIHQLLLSKNIDEANALLPAEKFYPIPDQIAKNIDATSGTL